MDELQQHYYDKLIGLINNIHGLELQQDIIDVLDKLVGDLLEKLLKYEN